MGQRGPAPAPVALKVLKNERKDRIATAPKEQDAPVKPDGLSDGAAVVWDRVMDATAHTRHIGQHHADILRRYCEVVATLDGWAQPASKEWRELANVQRQLARELCLTPATGGHLPGKVTQERKLDRFIGTRTG